MANRYWVGGTGIWSSPDDEVTPKWASESGGVANHTNFPSSTDNAIIDSNSGFSGGGTITVGGGTVECHDLILQSGHTFTYTSDGNTIDIYGSFTWESTVSVSAYADFDFYSSGIETITSGGKTFRDFTFYGTGSWTLQDNLTIGGDFYIDNGTFDANDKDITADNFYFYGDVDYTPTIVMGSGSWITTGGGSSVWIVNEDTDNTVTITPETSTIKITGDDSTSKAFNGGGKTYNNIWLAEVGLGEWDLITYIKDSNTFNNFRIDASPLREVRFYSKDTITVSTFNVSGTVDNVMKIVPANYTATETSQILITSLMGIGSSTNDSTYQKFTLTRSVTLVAITSYLARVGSTTDYSIKCSVLTDNNGVPGNLIVSCNTNKSSADIALYPSASQFNYSFAETDMTAGTYWIKYEQVGGTPSDDNYCLVACSAGLTDSYVSGEGYYQPQGGNLTSISSLFGAGYDYADLYFSFIVKSKYTFSKSSGMVSCDYLDISNSVVTGGAKWFAGHNSVDSGYNFGWIFDAPKSPFPSHFVS